MITAFDLLSIGLMVVLASATAFGLVGSHLLKVAEGVVRRNIEELTIWQSIQTAKLAKLEKDIVDHAAKIDTYLNEKEADGWIGNVKRGQGRGGNS